MVGESGATKPRLDTTYRTNNMTILDLTKATVFCAALAFLIYTFPILGQIVVIGLLSLLWLCYARQALHKLRRR